MLLFFLILIPNFSFSNDVQSHASIEKRLAAIQASISNQRGRVTVNDWAELLIEAHGSGAERAVFDAVQPAVPLEQRVSMKYQFADSVHDSPEFWKQLLSRQANRSEGFAGFFYRFLKAMRLTDIERSFLRASERRHYNPKLNADFMEFFFTPALIPFLKEDSNFLSELLRASYENREHLNEDAFEKIIFFLVKHPGAENGWTPEAILAKGMRLNRNLEDAPYLIYFAQLPPHRFLDAVIAFAIDPRRSFDLVQQKILELLYHFYTQTSFELDPAGLGKKMLASQNPQDRLKYYRDWIVGRHFSAVHARLVAQAIVHHEKNAFSKDAVLEHYTVFQDANEHSWEHPAVEKVIAHFEAQAEAIDVGKIEAALDYHESALRDFFIRAQERAQKESSNPKKNSALAFKTLLAFTLERPEIVLQYYGNNGAVLRALFMTWDRELAVKVFELKRGLDQDFSDLNDFQDLFTAYMNRNAVPSRFSDMLKNIGIHPFWVTRPSETSQTNDAWLITMQEFIQAGKKWDHPEHRKVNDFIVTCFSHPGLVTELMASPYIWPIFALFKREMQPQDAFSMSNGGIKAAQQKERKLEVFLKDSEHWLKQQLSKVLNTVIVTHSRETVLKAWAGQIAAYFTLVHELQLAGTAELVMAGMHHRFFQVMARFMLRHFPEVLGAAFGESNDKTEIVDFLIWADVHQGLGVSAEWKSNAQNWTKTNAIARQLNKDADPYGSAYGKIAAFILGRRSNTGEARFLRTALTVKGETESQEQGRKQILEAWRIPEHYLSPPRFGRVGAMLRSCGYVLLRKRS